MRRGLSARCRPRGIARPRRGGGGGPVDKPPPPPPPQPAPHPLQLFSPPVAKLSASHSGQQVGAGGGWGGGSTSPMAVGVTIPWLSHIPPLREPGSCSLRAGHIHDPGLQAHNNLEICAPGGMGYTHNTNMTMSWGCSNKGFIPYHTVPYHTIPYHTAPYRTIPYRTVPYRTTPYHTRQDKTRQDKTRQDKTRQDKTRQDKTRQDKTRQDKTRQDKTRQDKTRQDKTTHTYTHTKHRHNTNTPTQKAISHPQEQAAQPRAPPLAPHRLRSSGVMGVPVPPALATGSTVAHNFCGCSREDFNVERGICTGKFI